MNSEPRHCDTMIIQRSGRPSPRKYLSALGRGLLEKFGISEIYVPGET